MPRTLPITAPTTCMSWLSIGAELASTSRRASSPICIKRRPPPTSMAATESQLAWSTAPA
eukprot:CAMPEP_0170213728 /NCGR_PEP_ID=MMETSP0116_2-20130129/6490_1 /TAXON_ID=400756 /ORGANISM="Durinskia baltica, Strain CSIRO CS-38" /LENGTH=59 /DNA_ID=CAMNT_0010464283 /DNA_START=671 /DNA_END=850 /DNA_ORIENTATION=-